MEREKLKSIEEWVENVAAITKPDKIIYCDGSQQEYEDLLAQMEKDREIIKLNQETYPDCYLYRSDVRDVARTEKATFIIAEHKDDVGPLNNFMTISEASSVFSRIAKNSMSGKTMYVVPYLMGPVGSQYSEAGVEITDNPYVVVNMRIMTRMGDIATPLLEEDENFVRSIHITATLDPDNRYIMHFPWKRLDVDAHVISMNTAYGGNALLSKKCHALRIASVEAQEQGWMAEHMLILELENPEGKKYYFLAAFPSASGKTNLAMLNPPDEYARNGWKARLIGDDIAWIHVGSDGRLYAINPENGFFGVVPGTSNSTNPNAMLTIRSDTIFTNVGLTEQDEPWWEDLQKPSGTLLDWQGQEYKEQSGKKVAHPNSRFTSPLMRYPHLSNEAENPDGVPITAIIFGGRRGSTVPLVYEAFDWNHGVFLGATMGVEQTAAAEGKVGEIRRDPMAMRPFCAYNISRYFRHWIDIGRKARQLPGIYYVNWFRRNGKGNFVWPGFGENIRVLEWMIQRYENRIDAVKTTIGYIPRKEDLNIASLNLEDKDLDLLLKIDPVEWEKEAEEIGSYLESLGSEVPPEVREEFEGLKSRLKTAR